MKQNQAQIDQLSRALASWQQDINVLQTGIADIDQVVKAYTQGIQALGDTSGFQSFVTQKGSMAAAALGTAGTAVVDAKVAQYDADVQSLTKNIPVLQASADQALSAYQTALNGANGATDAQKAYNDAKGALSEAQTIVADIKNLQKQIVAASDSGDSGTMYFLVGEMSSQLSNLKLPSPAELKTQLTTALMALEGALKKSRDAKDASDQRKARWPPRDGAIRLHSGPNCARCCSGPRIGSRRPRQRLRCRQHRPRRRVIHQQRRTHSRGSRRMADYTVLYEVGESIMAVLWQEMQADPQVQSVISSEDQISLESPADLEGNDTVRLSIYLYRIAEDAQSKNRPAINDGRGRLRKPPLALDLYYLVTPLLGQPREQQIVLGKTMQVLYDRATLQGTDLFGSLQSSGESVAA